jgi:phenylalanine ammonia-lyase
MNGFSTLLREEVDTIFSSFTSSSEQDTLHSSLLAAMSQAFDKSTIMDSADQMHQVSSSAIPSILDFFKRHPEVSADALSLSVLSDFQTRFAEKATELHHSLRRQFLSGARGVAPASEYLGLTRRVYVFVRQDLGVKMHGDENLAMFPRGINADNGSIGQNISKIYEVCPCDLGRCVLFVILFSI